MRRFRLQDGSELREQLLTLSDADMAFSYCLLDTPMPLFNYVAHVRLAPVTDGDRTFWHWESRFDTPPGREERACSSMVGEDIYQGGFDAIRAHLAAGGDDDRTVETYPTLGEAAARDGARRGYLGGGTLVMREVNAGDRAARGCCGRPIRRCGEVRVSGDTRRRSAPA